MVREKEIVLNAKKKNQTTKKWDGIIIPIPEGYQRTSEELVIRRISDKSEFVWIPVEMLDENGTLDGLNFNNKFGRRRFHNERFSETEYVDEMTIELKEQIKSVEKYGGFYVSRFLISKSNNEVIQSKKNAEPLVNVTFDEAVQYAESFGNGKNITSHLLYGAEYDSILCWLSKKAIEKITIDDEYILYLMSRNADEKVMLIGDKRINYLDEIYDLNEDCMEWTNEVVEMGSYRVIRQGGLSNDSDYIGSIAGRKYDEKDVSDNNLGFRAVLCIQD